MRTNSTSDELREANVVVELYLREPVSEDELDAASDEVLDAVTKHAGDIALGPTVALNVRDSSIRLRFDVRTRSEGDAYRRVADVIAWIEEHSGLSFDKTRSAVAAPGRAA